MINRLINIYKYLSTWRIYLANIDHLMFYHLTPAPRNNLMERMFFRGVSDVRKDWSSSKDGTMVVLPLDSDEIIITEIN